MHTEIILSAKGYHEMAKHVRDISKRWIEDFIKNNSPVQVGERVKTGYWGRVEVTEVKLHAEANFGTPRDSLSFSYEGIPVTQKGQMMKNRKPVAFTSCVKEDGHEIHNPSYLRVEICPAKTYIY